MAKSKEVRAKSPEALVKRIRTAMRQAKPIAIIGWAITSHDEFTKKLSSDKVAFSMYAPAELCKRYGYAIYTTAILTPAFGLERRKYKGCIHPRRLSVNEIKGVLQACASVLTEPSEAPPAPAVPAAMPVVVPSSVHNEKEEEKHVGEPSMEAFAVAFVAAAEANGQKPGFVGKVVLGKLLKKHRVTQARLQLARRGWLIKEVSAGRDRAGWYKAGEKLLAAAVPKHPAVPEEPYAYAQWLVGQKGSVTARKAELQAQFEVEMARLTEKLQEIEKAEALLTQLNALRPKTSDEK